MKTFFVTINGKEVTWKPTREEMKEYRKICEIIWGALPLDISWAIETQIYKNMKQKLSVPAMQQ